MEEQEIVSGDDVTVALPLFQEEGGGASPTSPHQLRLKEINKSTAQRAYNEWHYLSGKGFLSSVNYGVFHEGKMQGCISYGIPNAPSMKDVYDSRTQRDYMELTRLALSEDCPKNSESRVIGVSLRLLKKRYPHLVGVITYADTEQNHTGIIYKATGFDYRGLTAQKTDFYIDGKKAGKMKGVKYSELEGEWKKRSRKHLFIKEFKK